MLMTTLCTKNTSILLPLCTFWDPSTPNATGMLATIHASINTAPNQHHIVPSPRKSICQEDCSDGMSIFCSPCGGTGLAYPPVVPESPDRTISLFNSGDAFKVRLECRMENVPFILFSWCIFYVCLCPFLVHSDKYNAACMKRNVYISMCKKNSNCIYTVQVLFGSYATRLHPPNSQCEGIGCGT